MISSFRNTNDTFYLLFSFAGRELATLQKEAGAIETSLEQKKLEKHNRLLDCKLQDLGINLLLGSLDDISEIEVQ